MISTSTRTSRACMAALASLLLALTACGDAEVEEPEASEPAPEQPAVDEDPTPDDDSEADENPMPDDDSQADGHDATDVDDDARTPATPVAEQPASSPNPSPHPPSTKPKSGTSALGDGRHAGRLVSIDTANVTLELVRVLSGDDAVAAAKAEGVPLEDGTLPNDVYVQDLKRTVTVPVAGDGGFLIYDCSAGCELVGTTLDALASGRATAYGGATAVVEVQVDAGAVVSLVEVYLP
jgi:hypothetical protein